MNLVQSKTIRWIGGGLIFAMLLLSLFTIPPSLPSYRKVVQNWVPSESWLFDRNGVLIDSVRVDFHARRLGWVPLDKISPALLRSVVTSEDKRFFKHSGIDWLAVGSALRSRLNGTVSRGASTISMQVAAFLSPTMANPGRRNWFDKLRQLRAAKALEGRWSKNEILEAYLNLAGFRGEAQGIAAAALSLFGKSPDALTNEDVALLTAMLPAPGASSAQVAQRACRLAPNLDCVHLRVAALVVNDAERHLALDPGLAPHLAVKLLKRPGQTVRTTLDRNIQVLATTALRRQLMMLGRERVRDGAAIVVDNVSGNVLAYVGGVGGESTASAVDGADSLRQAGSTLKPFLYAQAIELGYLTPASILDDSPVQLDTASGLYVPQNYDKGFKGPVSVRTALASSLNVPAVRTLLLVGPDAFRDRLWDSGYHGLTEDGQYYGFSLALGSAEVTLLEQAAAFRGLALGGRWSALRIRQNDPSVELRNVTNPQAAWLIGNILSDPAARATTFGLDSAIKLPFWTAAKTGTSKAMRDNWCIGFSDRFTVAVWVGNLEGDSMTAVSGTSGAAPVWRDIMLALHEGRPSLPPLKPVGIEMRRIQFENIVEPTRTEYFVTGTAQNVQRNAPSVSRRPHISNPVSGSVFALDPDIPINRQRMGVLVSGEVENHRLLLDKQDLGPAGNKPQLEMHPGVHALALFDGVGKQVDRVIFTVR